MYEPTTQMSNYKLLQQLLQVKLFAPFAFQNPLFLAKSEVLFRHFNLALPSPIVNYTPFLNGTRAVGDSLSLPNAQEKILNISMNNTRFVGVVPRTLFFCTTSNTWAIPVNTGSFFPLGASEEVFSGPLLTVF